MIRPLGPLGGVPLDATPYRTPRPRRRYTLGPWEAVPTLADKPYRRWWLDAVTGQPLTLAAWVARGDWTIYAPEGAIVKGGVVVDHLAARFMANGALTDVFGPGETIEWPKT